MVASGPSLIVLLAFVGDHVSHVSLRNQKTVKPRSEKGDGSRLKVGAEFDRHTRSESYARAHFENPNARRAELDTLLQILGSIDGMDVVEIGAGQGFLTAKICELVGTAGRVTAADNSERQVERLAAACPTASCLVASSECLPIASGSVDLVVSLANFHHVVDKSSAFKECARILRHGGRLVLADVCNGTKTQEYFDGVVDRICSTGHKHAFLDKESCREHCSACGLSLVSWELKSVPWVFESQFAAGRFLKRIHDASCSSQHCWREARRFLGLASPPGTDRVMLDWQLFFMVAIK